MNKKILLTSGCSFTENNETWPIWTSDMLDLELVNMGMGCQGNGLISKKLMYQVKQLLKRVEPQEILVGVMWSEPSRMEWYTEDELTYPMTPETFQNMHQHNPCKFVHNGPGAWLYTNISWMDRTMSTPDISKWATDFYTGRFCNITAMQIRTYEIIMNTQNFLQNLGIDYFMTTFTGKVFLPEDDLNPDITWIKDCIDWTKFLPVDGCLDWCYYNTDLPFNGDDVKPQTVPNQDHVQGEWGPYSGDHPSPEQHELFSQQVILPFLKDKTLIKS